jgi:heme oxygenase (mycobilin-producing)
MDRHLQGGKYVHRRQPCSGRRALAGAVRGAVQDPGGADHQQPGFVRLQVLRPADADSPYVVLTTWRDKSAFEAWVNSEDFRLAHQHPLPKEAYTGDGRLEQHDVVIAAEARITP